MVIKRGMTDIIYDKENWKGLLAAIPRAALSPDNKKTPQIAIMPVAAAMGVPISNRTRTRVMEIQPTTTGFKVISLTRKVIKTIRATAMITAANLKYWVLLDV